MEAATIYKKWLIIFGLFLSGCDQFSQSQSSVIVLPLEGSRLSLEQVEDAYTLAYDTQFDDDFVIGVDFEYKGEPTGRGYTLRVHKGDAVWLRVWGTRDKGESYTILDRQISSLEYAFQVGESLAKRPALDPHDYEEQREEQKMLEKMTEKKLAEFLGIDIKKQSSSSRSRSRSRTRRAENEEKNLKKYDILVEETENPQPFKVEILAEDLGVPWGMVFINNKELLWTERDGAIKKIYIPTGQITQITGGPEAYFDGQGGLLDVALHPNFQRNKYIYFTFSLESENDDSSTTALARGRLEGNRITNLRTLFTAEPFYHSGMHFGSRLAFDRNGFLFMTIGDRRDRQEAQNLNNHFGKLLRLTDEGRPASGNPFTGTAGAKPEIWTRGHRNAQGLFIHPETRELYLQEHGPKGGDEINLIEKGANYGWPVITHGTNYDGTPIGEGTHKAGMEQPVKYWTPAIAPGGMLIYSGKQFPEWRGNFFSGALAGRHLNRLNIRNNEEERLLSSLDYRFRHVIEDPQGFIYVSVDQGMILRISPL